MKYLCANTERAKSGRFLWKRKTLCEMNSKWVSWEILQIRLKQDEQKFKVLEWSHLQA